MTTITDNELTTIRNALVFVREALAEDQSPEGTKVKEQIIEAEQIVSAKLKEGGSGETGGPSGNSSQNLAHAMATGGSSITVVAAKTKSLFDMFSL